MTGKPVLAASARAIVLFPDPASPVTMTRRPTSAGAASLINASVPQVLARRRTRVLRSRRSVIGGSRRSGTLVLGRVAPRRVPARGHSVRQCPGRSWLVSGDFAEVRYADAGGVSIAYCIRGAGPIDLVGVPGV